MIVFAVFQRGVYRHECGGIYTEEAKACEAATDCARKDKDSWHEYEVVPFDLDSVPAWDSTGYYYHSVEAAPIFTISKDKL